MNPHRVPGEREVDCAREPLHVGKRVSCPACGAIDKLYCSHCKNNIAASTALTHKCQTCTTLRDLNRKLSEVLYCTEGARLRTGPRWELWWAFCRQPGNHLHQNCLNCKATWTCATVESVT